MLINQMTQIKVINKTDPAEFEKEFNSAMVVLADKNPKYTLDTSNGFTALITYTDTIRQMDCIADEYHAEGIKYTCRECPLREIQTDGRKKDAVCKHAMTGKTNLNSEACEVFYRRLKMEDIEPIGEPTEIAPASWRKRNYKKIREEHGVSSF